MGYVLTLFGQFWICPCSLQSVLTMSLLTNLFGQFWICPCSRQSVLPISPVSSWLAVHHTKSVGHHTHHLLVSRFESPSLTAFLRLRDNAKLHRHLELACCCSWGDLSKFKKSICKLFQSLIQQWVCTPYRLGLLQVCIWESGIGIIWKFCHTGPGPWPFSCTDWVWGGWKCNHRCSPDHYLLMIEPIWFLSYLYIYTYIYIHIYIYI